MSDFASQQDRFQLAILTEDEAVLAEISDSPQETRRVLFGVYKNAYASRLVEAMGNDYKLLHTYVGDDMFDEMGRAYIAVHPSKNPNIRWFGQKLPAFLRSTDPYSDYPILADLAALENALNDAFDAVDAPVVTLENVAAFPPEHWNDLTFEAHPSVCQLEVTTNVAAIWSALKQDQEPPDAIVLEHPSTLLIWRNDTTPMFRELTDEEARTWGAAAAGVSFGEICNRLAVTGDSDTAAVRGASYLHGWVTGGLLTHVGTKAEWPLIPSSSLCLERTRR